MKILCTYSIFHESTTIQNLQQTYFSFSIQIVFKPYFAKKTSETVKNQRNTEGVSE